MNTSIPPLLANIDLYKTSGHWDHYQDSMFPPMDMGDGEKLILRPMNCPTPHANL